MKNIELQLTEEHHTNLAAFIALLGLTDQVRTKDDAVKYLITHSTSLLENQRTLEQLRLELWSIENSKRNIKRLAKLDNIPF